MGLGLIDEYRIFVSPVVFGGGRPMFKDIKDTLALKLLQTSRLLSGRVIRHQPA
jgi:dihydrofolate reductase